MFSAVYNGYNLVDHFTDGKGQVTQYVYDAVGRVTGVTYADGMSMGYSFDRAGRMLAMTKKLTPSSPNQTSQYTLDSLGDVTQETRPDGSSVSYTYDADGNVTSLTDAAGTVSYQYNSRGEWSQVTARDGGIFRAKYDADGRQTDIDYPGGISRQVSYNADGNPTDIVATDSSLGTTPLNLSYSYVSGSQPTKQPTTSTNSLGYTVTTTYNGFGEVATVTLAAPNGTFMGSDVYNYNAIGGETSVDETDANHVTTHCPYVFNDAGQPTVECNQTVTYDPNGSVLQGMSAAYAYNGNNQTVSIIPDGGSPQAVTTLGRPAPSPPRPGRTPTHGPLADLQRRTTTASS
jgi:YD repeat-containing protein